MDDKMKELLEKMKELGMTETDVLKTLNISANEKEDEPVDEDAFKKVMCQMRTIIKNAVKEIYIEKVDKLSAVEDIMTISQFKAEYRELAIAENTRVVSFANNIAIKLSKIDGNKELREDFLKLMISTEDVVYGNVLLFRSVSIGDLYRFAIGTGVTKAASYSFIKENVECNNILTLTTEDEKIKAKEDMKNLVATIFRGRFASVLDDKYVVEFIKLASLKDIVFDDIKDEDDMFIAYGTTISLLLIIGVIRVRTMLKVGLEEVKIEVENSGNQKLLELIGRIN
ncbi:hypothetical protein [uncultured Clostridium sp.]|jgi:hypothetical protein|uniref:hypothetical protein n=1 Tax=uncultured Clostridium sp. TaxID=59620 RepID=UPI0026396F36|nr:hypothetical protein [uncultured Clostridium sp.]